MASAPTAKLPTRSGERLQTRRIFVYLGSLTLLVSLARPDGSLFNIPVSFMLKNQLHASATQVSTFWFTTSIPIYVAFAFGLLRDHWDPIGLRDRGFFLFFAPLTAIAFLWMASARLRFEDLLLGVMMAMVSYQLIVAAQSGLITLVGQEKFLSGRLSAMWKILEFVPSVGATFASGYVTEHLSPAQIFTMMAFFSSLLFCIAFWKPSYIFGDRWAQSAYEAPQAKNAGLLADLVTLVKDRAIYPAVLILALWHFVPGVGTPLQFYLTNNLHSSDAVFAYFRGILIACHIPGFLFYGYLCRRVSLEKLLFYGTLVAIPGVIPLLFIHSSTLALLVAPMSLLWGIAGAAYLDLAMRSCPPGLQGTLMMLIGGVVAVAGNGGDLFGSWIYNSSPSHGFLYCMIAAAATTALILPILLLVSKELVATADGESGQLIRPHRDRPGAQAPSKPR